MNERAFALIALQLRQAALNACRQQGADEAEAEDIAQDTLLRLWQMRRESGKGRPTEALAAVIARHLLYDQRRRQRAFPLSALSIGIGSSESSPHERLETSENEQWLEQRLAKRPTTQHAVLYMRQVEERSLADIARLLGITEGSVSTLLARARRTLLEEIKKRRK